MENQVQLIGNLGMNPEAKNINDTVKATFTLATNTVYRDSDGNKKTMTDWHNIVAWGGLAQTIEQYVKKGDKIAVLEAMKMQTTLYASADGTVDDILVQVGESVESKDLIAKLRS